MKSTRLIHSIASVAVVALLATSCGGSDESESVDTTESTEATADTEAPVVTDAPIATEAPVESDAPIATEAPAETDAPVETEAPVDTEAPDEANRFTDPTGTFSLIFPDGAEPEENVQTIPVPAVGETIDVPFYILDGGSYAVTGAYIDYTPIAVDGLVVDLQGVVDGAISEIPGAVLTSQTETTVQGRDAIEYEFTLDGGVGRSIVVEEGLGVVQVQALGESLDGEVGTFVDSLQFTEDA